MQNALMAERPPVAQPQQDRSQEIRNLFTNPEYLRHVMTAATADGMTSLVNTAQCMLPCIDHDAAALAFVLEAVCDEWMRPSRRAKERRARRALQNPRQKAARAKAAKARRKGQQKK